jgi:hypothetical protein
LLAALDPRIHDLELGASVEWSLGAVAFVLAILGVLLGSQVLRGHSKAEWLHNRAATERLRELHFQWLVRRLPSIAAATDAAEATKLQNERDLLLAHVDDTLKPGVGQPVARIMEDLGGAHCWMVERRDQSQQLQTAPKERLDQLFQAYAKLRFDHQIEYVAKKLDEGHGLWPWGPRGQAERLRQAGNALTVLVIVLHAMILAVLAFGDGHSPFVPWLQTVGMMGALTVLALRVLDEGLNPRVDVARYRNYRGEAAELFRQYTAGDPQAKLAQMERMEELNYRELRDFLTTNDEASFVL